MITLGYIIFGMFWIAAFAWAALLIMSALHDDERVRYGASRAAFRAAIAALACVAALWIVW